MAPLRSGLCPLLTDEIVAKLKRVGIKTVFDFVSEPAEVLSKRAGLPHDDLQSIRHSLLAQFASYPLPGRDAWAEECTRQELFSTGCSPIDRLLGGGVVAGQLTEVCGPPASGKTQLCLSLTASVTASNSTVVYIDSGCGFSSTRLIQFLEGRGFKEERILEVLRRVKVYRVWDIFSLFDVLHTLRISVAEQKDGFHSNLKLIILDTITYYISPLLGGRQFHGHAVMARLSMALKALAIDHHMALLYTNNVVVDFNNEMGVVGGGVKPALGRTWKYVPNTRLMLTHQDSRSQVDRSWVATITKSATQEHKRDSLSLKVGLKVIQPPPKLRAHHTSL